MPSLDARRTKTFSISMCPAKIKKVLLVKKSELSISLSQSFLKQNQQPK